MREILSSKYAPMMLTIESDSMLLESVAEEGRQILAESPSMDEDSAMILAIARHLIRSFDEFMEDTLQIQYSEGELYAVECTIHEFVSHRNPIRYMMTELGVYIAKVYPNIASQFFADRVSWFTTHIKSIELTGRIKDMYDLQADLHDFLRTLEGGILTNQLEQALKNFEGLSPDVKKLYMDGIKNLGSKAKTGRMIFDVMCKMGLGIPTTMQEISNLTGKSRPTVKKGIEEILDNAGHMIRIEYRGTLETYFIPEEIRRLHV